VSSFTKHPIFNCLVGLWYPGGTAMAPVERSEVFQMIPIDRDPAAYLHLKIFQSKSASTITRQH
jgi:hypothetical protein